MRRSSKGSRSVKRLVARSLNSMADGLLSGKLSMEDVEEKMDEMAELVEDVEASDEGMSESEVIDVVEDEDKMARRAMIRKALRRRSAESKTRKARKNPRKARKEDSNARRARISRLVRAARKARRTQGAKVASRRTCKDSIRRSGRTASRNLRPSRRNASAAASRLRKLAKELSR